MEMRARIKVGVSSWTEKTLVDAGWYPPGARDAESRLRYYASRFSLVEVDATYYALPTRHQAEVWTARTPPGFTMNVKAYAPFTAHYTEPKRFPKDLQAALPTPLRARSRLYPRDLPDEIRAELARRFREALQPLVDGGRLGVVLFQYPVWFPFSAEHRRQMAAARDLLPGLRLAVEFRNHTWLSERNRGETIAFLRAHGLAYTCVDEPQGFPSSVPPVAEATAEVALVRFHGRNLRTWDRKMASAAQRMDYLYTPGELREWVPRIDHLAGEAREVHVVMNNCHRDYAVRNAEDMAALLGLEAGRPEERPESGGP